MDDASHRPTEITEQTAGHLNLLKIFHYVLGGLTAVGTLFPLFYILMGAVFMMAATGELIPEHDMPAEHDMLETSEDEKEMVMAMGGLFIILGAVASLLVLALAVMTIMAGRKIGQRRGHTFCLVIAGIQCLSFPFGTALGVCTIIVLSKPEVKRLFTSFPGRTPS